MRKMTAEEVKAHNQRIKAFREKSAKITDRYNFGDITKKKWEETRKAIKEEENDYIRQSGIIMYYGQLFIGG